MEAAIASVVVGVLSLIGVVVSNLVTNNKTIYRIEQLELKQEKHNKVIERVIVLEKVFAIDEDKIKEMNKEIDKIKEEIYKQNTSRK
ncbi:MAG: hypothetical protein J6U54_13560 [Clostridiales bacterium]|nr:hypothetical protein [Clostridiales bacterium]